MIYTQKNDKLDEKRSAKYIGPYISALERVFDLYMITSDAPFDLSQLGSENRRVIIDNLL